MQGLGGLTLRWRSSALEVKRDKSTSSGNSIDLQKVLLNRLYLFSFNPWAFDVSNFIQPWLDEMHKKWNKSGDQLGSNSYRLFLIAFKIIENSLQRIFIEAVFNGFNNFNTFKLQSPAVGTYVYKALNF